MDNLSNFGQKIISISPKFLVVNPKKTTGDYTAPMLGEVLKIHVEINQNIKEGEALMTLLSMKMENTIVAHHSGKITEIFVEKGNTTKKGTILLNIEKNNSFFLIFVA